MKQSVTLLGVFLLFALSATTHAAQPGWYGGVGFGQSDYDLGVSDFDDGSLLSGNVDETDTAFKIFLGNRINENVSIEFGYLNLGEATFEGVSDGSALLFDGLWEAGPVSADAETDGIHLAFIGNIPISDRLGLMAKAGLFVWDVSLGLSDTSGSYSGDEDGTDLFFGLGLDYEITDKVAIRGEWERYSMDFGIDGDIDADLFSASLIFRFQ